MSVPGRNKILNTNPSYISGCVILGRPACCYVNTAGALQVATCPNADGSGVWVVTTVDAGPNIMYTSMVVYNGTPCIAYSKRVLTTTGLYFIKGANADGSGWPGAPTLITATAGIVRGYWCSLWNVDGLPAIAYYNQTTSTVEYVRALDAGGSTWSAIQSISPIYYGGININLRVFQGRPAVCYYDSTRFRLVYQNSNTTTGLPQPAISQTWNDPFILDANSAGFGCSMAELDNAPMISYYQVKTISNQVERLKFISARTNGFDNFDWSPSAAVVVSSSGAEGLTSLVNLLGYPSFSYYNSDNDDLNSAISTSILGFTAWYLKILDNSTTAGLYLSSIVIGAKMGTFYSDPLGDMGGAVLYYIY